MKRFVVVGAALAATVCAAWPAVSGAEVTSTSGAAVEIAAPASVDFGALESDTRMVAFDERQDVTLSAALGVDITAPGTYDDVADLTPGTVPGGTVVSSHLVHCDPVGTRGPRVQLDGTVTFSDPIVGVIVRQARLDASDAPLGAAGTAYPTGRFGRAFSLANAQSDAVVYLVDRHTLQVHCDTRKHVDQLRVVTRAEDAPPPPGGQGCTPGYWKQPHHFDSWAPTGLAPTDAYEATFGVDVPGSPTLAEALAAKGGGVAALERHSTAALLDALHPGVDYAFTAAQVIAQTQAALASGDAGQIASAKDAFDAANNGPGGCPLS